MKYVASAQPRCRSCKVITRNGQRLVICAADPKHKQTQGRPLNKRKGSSVRGAQGSVATSASAPKQTQTAAPSVSESATSTAVE